MHRQLKNKKHAPAVTSKSSRCRRTAAISYWHFSKKQTPIFSLLLSLSLKTKNKDKTSKQQTIRMHRLTRRLNPASTSNLSNNHNSSHPIHNSFLIRM
jgi:hypothetical protein